MKGNLFLCLALLFSTAASADHLSGEMSNAPLPVQECYSGARALQQFVTIRRAGLTLEEVLDYNSYTIRVVKYVASHSGEEFDDADAEEHDNKARKVFALSDEEYTSNVFVREWVTIEFDVCVAAIPQPLTVPSETETDAIDRMLQYNE